MYMYNLRSIKEYTRRYSTDEGGLASLNYYYLSQKTSQVRQVHPEIPSQILSVR